MTTKPILSQRTESLRAKNNQTTMPLAINGNPDIHRLKKLTERSEYFPTSHASPITRANPAHFSHHLSRRLNHHHPKNSSVTSTTEAMPYRNPKKYGLFKRATTNETIQKMSRHRNGKRRRGLPEETSTG